MAEITLKNIVKNYGKTEVVHGINLDIAHNEFVVLVGPSGCGKSTTLRMIAGLEDITGGTITIGDEVVNDLPPRKRNISMVFQNYALYPHMSVRENLGFGLKIAKQDEATIIKRVDEAADILGLDELMERTPAELSGGQRQRVAMGRAIVRHPEAFLFDEPLSNLDAKLRVQMRTEIKKLHQKVKTTVVYVTHDQVEAMTLADRIVVMKDGYIEQVGTPMEVFNHPVNTFVAKFIGSPPMNLLPATIKGKNIVFADDKTLPVPARLADLVRDGQKVVFGLRPDDLTPVGHGIAESGDGARVTLDVVLSEPLGTETILYTSIAGQEAQGKMFGPRIVEPGETLEFDVAMDKAHLFDAGHWPVGAGRLMAAIVKADVLMVDLAPKVVRTDAIQSFVSQETPIVRLTDADGHVGTGYSYTIGTGGPAVISLLRETLLPLVIGREAEEIEGIWRELLLATHATAVGAITSLALATIDTALWDLRCRRAGLPLWRLAGGAKSSVPLYSTEGGWLHIETEALVADALAMQEKGFAGSKIKIGKPALAADRARLKAVRDAVGDDYHILVDANQSFTLAEARRRADMLAEFDIGWFEEPMPADDVGAHVQLTAASPVPIAVGESMYSLSQFKDYLAMGGCTIVQADVARVGGITPWLKIAHMAEGFNVAICPHFLMELHVSLTCAVPNAPMLEYIPQLDEITTSRLDIRDGNAHAPMTPGLGIDWNWDAINARAIAGLSATLGGS